MKTPKVSVIIPCYNVEKYIARCLDSLTKQTLKDIEIICVNDKSTDNTAKIVKKYAQSDKKIHVVELKQNSGAAVARNMGLNIASGEYIGFVDPDDYVDTDFYEKLYNTTTENKYDIVIGNVIINYQNSKCYVNKNFQSKIKSDGVVAFASCFWAGIYKRIFLKKHKIKFPDKIRYSQDCVFLTLTTLFAENIFCVKDTFYHYLYQRPGSLDSDILSNAKAESKYNAFKMNLNYINKNKIKDAETKELYIVNHVLGHLNYEIRKKYQDDKDRKKMFDLLHILSLEYLPKKYFDKKQYKYIKRNDYYGFINKINHNVTKTVKIMGGIGNQMFQYAFGKVLGPETNYDISWFDTVKNDKNITQREYELGFWNIEPKLVKKAKKRRFLFFKIPHIIEKQSSVYEPDLLNKKRGIFEGYFQAIQYYEPIREQLLKDFTPKKQPNLKNQKILKLIYDTNSVSLHVRRGDYLKLQHIHGICNLDYYERSIEFIAKNIKNPHFFIFSDDIKWVKDNLKINFPCEYVDFNHGSDSAWDIWLMANCKHNIIANSSFSWWGAWLNQNPNKIVIAPKIWLADGRHTDNIPSQWKRI